MEATQDYKVNLSLFEGPLDLLLYLIKKNDLDIYDIPISFITEQYLKYLDHLQELNIDLAGEFLVMPSELAQIKSKMLLPQEGLVEEEEGQDPRAELARRLFEYQKFKTAAQKLTQRRMLGREWYLHPPMITEIDESNIPLESDVFKLVGAFEKILRRVPRETFHPIGVDRLSVSQRIYQILDILKIKEAVTLEDLLPNPLVRYDIVITFISLLEMAKLKMIAVHQEDPCGSLWVRCVMQIEESYGNQPITVDS